ncbi:hypothetical protein Tsubulata_007021 [Turnera subulata]|uniref:Uncharacterized protein n=1 Tax=Turnera subulata TaxID=218843 RepID=A0A9Q0FE78_9ROSI|nr:hypothetical protein Tsubulata_007021 [Turnera subulata]
MDPATAERLSQISREIQNIEAEKARGQETLAAFWEHLPPFDPAVVAAAMQQIVDRISGLENRRRALCREQEDLIIQAAAPNPPPPPPPPPQSSEK